MKRNCYLCPKKEKCYSPFGLKKLKPDNESDCGNLELLVKDAIEAAEFLKENGDFLKDDNYSAMLDLCDLLKEIEKEVSK